MLDANTMLSGADWEHVTMRMSPDAQQVLGIYYSAHR